MSMLPDYIWDLLEGGVKHQGLELVSAEVWCICLPSLGNFWLGPEVRQSHSFTGIRNCIQLTSWHLHGEKCGLCMWLRGFIRNSPGGLGGGDSPPALRNQDLFNTRLIKHIDGEGGDFCLLPEDYPHRICSVKKKGHRNSKKPFPLCMEYRIVTLETPKLQTKRIPACFFNYPNYVCCLGFPGYGEIRQVAHGGICDSYKCSRFRPFSFQRSFKRVMNGKPAPRSLMIDEGNGFCVTRRQPDAFVPVFRIAMGEVCRLQRSQTRKRDFAFAEAYGENNPLYGESPS
ncbi:hypothetical protein V8F20_004657 [Naviculisporaceae sp. PSN 640]